MRIRFEANHLDIPRSVQDIVKYTEGKCYKRGDGQKYIYQRPLGIKGEPFCQLDIYPTILDRLMHTFSDNGYTTLNRDIRSFECSSPEKFELWVDVDYWEKEEVKIGEKEKGIIKKVSIPICRGVPSTYRLIGAIIGEFNNPTHIMATLGKIDPKRVCSTFLTNEQLESEKRRRIAEEDRKRRRLCEEIIISDHYRRNDAGSAWFP